MGSDLSRNWYPLPMYKSDLVALLCEFSRAVMKRRLRLSEQTQLEQDVDRYVDGPKQAAKIAQRLLGNGPITFGDVPIQTQNNMPQGMTMFLGNKATIDAYNQMIYEDGKGDLPSARQK